MTNELMRPVAYFWDSVLQCVAPKSDKKTRTPKKCSEHKTKSIYRCTNAETLPSTFWFCNNSAAGQKAEKIAPQRQKAKRVHFSEKINVVLIQGINRGSV
ncbi:uncharacterized protein TEOVI_000604100 [Trypanosoma equiperdum]|uniref:Uncharacterized protein n=2 Tax=Trypanozoon TaxID=39700 RepID=A0A1G4HZ82_TRYEQ|nr:hypothetical protein DPX39_080038000 [Trypanosoma brucei equiperdum]SCU64492.1 hypothetical protein, conserved [Trypanosoma equiperdum]